MQALIWKCILHFKTPAYCSECKCFYSIFTLLDEMGNCISRNSLFHSWKQEESRRKDLPILETTYRTLLKMIMHIADVVKNFYNENKDVHILLLSSNCCEIVAVILACHLCNIAVAVVKPSLADALIEDIQHLNVVALFCTDENTSVGKRLKKQLCLKDAYLIRSDEILRISDTDEEIKKISMKKKRSAFQNTKLLEQFSALNDPDRIALTLWTLGRSGKQKKVSISFFNLASSLAVINSLQQIFTVAAAINCSHVSMLQNRFPNLHLHNGYGLCETTSITHIAALSKNNNTCLIGSLMPNTECKIVNPVTGYAQCSNRIGEIAVRGPTIILSTTNNPTEMTYVDAHGWLHTGDFGFYDKEECFYVLGKMKSRTDKEYLQKIIHAGIDKIMYQKEAFSNENISTDVEITLDYPTSETDSSTSEENLI
ncbi:hypothetical protein D917_04045 [Trichinella nativa]|uniref:AMP-dependent synthetase/ligase domain-containing protein n=1 Tax=Trichinella nativa TaxID=6335 RepID=A0A1Y3E5Z1_9BILA|nr:hypothetical protein D917_04045 [Trichinella nativa]